jgi:hypothetical protein
MNAVLPYILDRATRHYEREYYCQNAEVALAHLLGVNVPRQGFPRSDGFSRHNLDWDGYGKDGLDARGFNREGFNRDGLNKDGYNKDGFDRHGYNKDGFDKNGRDHQGHTAEEKVAALVSDWSDDFAAAIAEHVAKLTQVEEAKPAKKAPAKKAATAKKGVPTKKAPAKKVAAAKKAAPRKVNPFADVFTPA